jgi:structural maintenance of chromosome 3 (chondroitin sulfate proteoglycan 6)
MGLKMVHKIVKAHKITGYHGPLYDLFEVHENYRAAVEVTAGNRYAQPVASPIFCKTHTFFICLFARSFPVSSLPGSCFFLQLVPCRC